MRGEATLYRNLLEPVYQGFLERGYSPNGLPYLTWDLTNITLGPNLRLRNSRNSAEPDAIFIIGPYAVVPLLEIREQAAYLQGVSEPMSQTERPHTYLKESNCHEGVREAAWCCRCC